METLSEETTTPTKQFPCSSCTKHFTNEAKLQKHIETHNLFCEKCNLSFKTHRLKRVHLRDTHPQKRDKSCGICPELSFRTEEQYLLHIRDVHRGRFVPSYMCNVCAKMFKTRSELRQHIISKCGTEKLFVCKMCGQKLMSPGSLYNHMRRHSGEASFMCRFCAKLFLTAGELKVHERIHTQQKDFVCEVCGKGFCHRQSLITHSSVHTGIKPYQCEGCGKSFSCVGNLLKHRKSHPETCGALPLTTHRVENPSTRIKVKINTPASSKLMEVKRNRELQEKLAKLDALASLSGVEEDGIKNVGLENDISSEELSVNRLNSVVVNNEALSEETNEKLVKVEEGSNDSFAEISNETVAKDSRKKKKTRVRTRDPLLDQEVREFIEKRQLENGKADSCRYCKKKYSVFRWLYKHEREHLENGENLPFKCSCCRKCFETKEDVKQHQQTAHSEILACRECGDKMFANADSLRSHRRVFHKGTPRKPYVYICEKCGKKFKQKLLLRVHEETNCRGPFFQCDVCSKDFSSDHARKAHMRVHSSEKNLTCKFCGKGFRWKGQLKVHERSHTGEKPYACLFCPSSFAYRDSLITHSTLHTGIKPYFCKGCGWRFSCVGNLMKHRVTHASTCGAWYEREEKEQSVQN